MDRKKYGEIIVDQIINDYKNSKEFRDDAIAFIFKWLTNIINYRIANVGLDLSLSNLDKEAQKEFIKGMEKNNDLKEKIFDAYHLLTSEENQDFYPSHVSGDKNNQ